MEVNGEMERRKRTEGGERRSKWKRREEVSGVREEE